jgi:hypothetical protein
VAGVCLGVLVLAALLTPSAAGHGTHESLGLPACGVAATFGVPCVTCGMTTAFSHAARGQLVSAASAQPMGAILSVAAATMVWVGGFAAATGSPAFGALGGFLIRRGVWVGLGLLALSWVYKVIVW